MLPSRCAAFRFNLLLGYGCFGPLTTITELWNKGEGKTGQIDRRTDCHAIEGAGVLPYFRWPVIYRTQTNAVVELAGSKYLHISFQICPICCFD